MEDSLVPTATTSARSRAFCAYSACLAQARGDTLEAAVIYKSRFPRSLFLSTIERSAVLPMSTAPGSAEALSPLADLGAAFVEILRPRTLLNAFTAARTAPLNVRIPLQASGARLAWAAEGAPLAVTNPTFAAGTLRAARCGGVVVLTDELVRCGSPNAVDLIQSDLLAAARLFVDAGLLDPAADGSGASPASLLNAASEIVSGGTNAATTLADVHAAVAALAVAEVALVAPVFVTSARIVVHLAGLRDAGGFIFPNARLDGTGDLLGVPLAVSPAAADIIALIDAAELLVGIGAAEIDASREAAVEMRDDPADPTVAGTVLTSLFQRGLTGLRLTMGANWRLRRADAAAYISGYVVT